MPFNFIDRNSQPQFRNPVRTWSTETNVDAEDYSTGRKMSRQKKMGMDRKKNQERDNRSY